MFRGSRHLVESTVSTGMLKHGYERCLSFLRHRQDTKNTVNVYTVNIGNMLIYY